MNILAIYTYEYLYPKALLNKPLLDFRYIQIGFTGVLTNIMKKGHNVNLEVYTQYTDIEKFTNEIFKKKVIQEKFDYIINNYSISKKSKCINTLRLMKKHV